MFAHSYGFIGLDALAAPDTFENPGFFIMPVRRDQNRDRLAYRFLGGVGAKVCLLTYGMTGFIARLFAFEQRWFAPLAN